MNPPNDFRGAGVPVPHPRVSPSPTPPFTPPTSRKLQSSPFFPSSRTTRVTLDSRPAPSPVNPAPRPVSSAGSREPGHRVLVASPRNSATSLTFSRASENQRNPFSTGRFSEDNSAFATAAGQGNPRPTAPISRLSRVRSAADGQNSRTYSNLSRQPLANPTPAKNPAPANSANSANPIKSNLATAAFANSSNPTKPANPDYNLNYTLANSPRKSRVNSMALTEIDQPDPKARGRLAWLRDVIGLAIFVIVVSFGAILTNTYVVRSFNVVGPSMEPTLCGGASLCSANDRLIVNMLPVTFAKLSGKAWVPARGDIIVFRNPQYQRLATEDEYIVKRVIAFAGETVKIESCTLKIYNKENPNGFNPYKDFKTLSTDDATVNTCIDGDGTDVKVPAGDIFVVGDHRVGGNSMDSRPAEFRNPPASLGFIPLDDVVGPVSMRIWPLNTFTKF